MLSFVQSWLAPGAQPVGIDFGTDCLRMAQVDKSDGDYRLIAAASADVPSELRQDFPGRMAFFTKTLRELWSQGQFRGRRAVLGLPATHVHFQHLRLPRMDETSLAKAIPWETAGKLPMDTAQALLRHVVAGEVYQDHEPRTEVIVMAALRERVDQLLAAAAKARVDVVGLHVEPKALLDCFLNIYRRKSDAEATHCFIDIGYAATRAIVARGSQIYFARVIPIGGEHFSQAVAAEFNVPLEEARLLRLPRPGISESPEPALRKSGGPELRHAHLRPASPGPSSVERRQEQSATNIPAAPESSVAVAEPSIAVITADPKLDTALHEPLGQLVEQLSLCRRYHESAMPNRPIERLIFVGGEACQRGLCQGIAREMGIGAQVGDPMVRMGRTTEVGIESGIDRRQPQPAWAVAIGLSMGSRHASP